MATQRCVRSQILVQFHYFKRYANFLIHIFLGTPCRIEERVLKICFSTGREINCPLSCIYDNFVINTKNFSSFLPVIKYHSFSFSVKESLKRSGLDLCFYFYWKAKLWSAVAENNIKLFLVTSVFVNTSHNISVDCHQKETKFSWILCISIQSFRLNKKPRGVWA